MKLKITDWDNEIYQYIKLNRVVLRSTLAGTDKKDSPYDCPHFSISKLGNIINRLSSFGLINKERLNSKFTLWNGVRTNQFCYTIIKEILPENIFVQEKKYLCADCHRAPYTEAQLGGCQRTDEDEDEEEGYCCGACEFEYADYDSSINKYKEGYISKKQVVCFDCAIKDYYDAEYEEEGLQDYRTIGNGVDEIADVALGRQVFGVK